MHDTAYYRINEFSNIFLCSAIKQQIYSRTTECKLQIKNSWTIVL